jgi:CRP-like cAMP-binding protein
MTTLLDHLALIETLEDPTRVAQHAQVLQALDEPTMRAMLQDQALSVSPEALTQLRQKVAHELVRQTQALTVVPPRTRTQRLNHWMATHVRVVQVALTVACPLALLGAHPQVQGWSTLWPVLVLTAMMPTLARWVCYEPGEYAVCVRKT